MSDLVRLKPDDEELLIAVTRGLLSLCPFCGGDPLLFTEQNTKTGLFVARVFCADFRCGAAITCCMADRFAAQKGARKSWNRRHRPTQSDKEGGDVA